MLRIPNPTLIKSRYIRFVIYPLLLVFAIFQLNAKSLFASSQNGFDLESTLIPKEEIFHGGPPRDGIPALDYPEFVSTLEENYLLPDDRVLGVVQNGMARAYPVKILNYHEIVNDRFGNEPVVVVYCPLCGSGTAYSAIVNNKPYTFGVSGLLYNSDVLLYDRQTESLWSQLLSKAISGSMRGKHLRQIPLEHTSWADWKSRYPHTQVMSVDTGHNRDYTSSPYGSYASNESIYFPIKNRDRRYHPKEQVIGVEVNGQFKAYPFSELARWSVSTKLSVLKKQGKTVADTIAGKKVRIQFNGEHRTGRVYDDASNQIIPSVIVYWFAWTAFHPETDVFLAR